MTKKYCIFLISSMCLSAFARMLVLYSFVCVCFCTCKCSFLSVYTWLYGCHSTSAYIYVCIGLGCVILLREIISSNVRWPDSLPVLCSFRCINILKESPGETESLCKHNCHESVALCTLGLINRMKMDKICTHSMLIHLRRGDLLCLALLDQAFTIAFALLCYLQIFTAHVRNVLWL